MSGDPFHQRLGELGPALLNALAAFEEVRRRLDPPQIPALRHAAQPIATRLHEALAAFAATTPPDGLGDLAAQLRQSAEAADAAFELFCGEASPAQAIPRVLRAMHEHCHAQELLYPLRRVLPPVGRFFLEPAVRERAADFDPDPNPELPTGIITARQKDGGRGGFSLYVPEYYDGGRDWPLIVALHGGSGTGDDFLWTWLTEARSRGCLLLSPTSLGSTWSLMDEDIDAPALRAMVNYVREHWRVDDNRILLTGLSDGATYTLLCGLQPDMPFTALAPVSGVLHPGNLMNGNLERAAGRRIYLVHGARDWMFPIATARIAHRELQRAGADVTFREIEDLSHTYPRQENGRILEWWDPSLRLDAKAD
ncbi:MAG TPA: phospholipase [Candidatus Dormibacteraeota bacterium]|nr:phospholipase [Candidatus Dormibacteraeota bacterium]